jgi:hypothetical protein
MSPGELLDRLTILEIKGERFRDEAKRTTSLAERQALEGIWEETVRDLEAFQDRRRELKAVNESLWQTEDDLRNCERGGEFGERFVALARSVYRLNDQRAALKRQVNELLGSSCGEQKQYGEACSEVASTGLT